MLNDRLHFISNNTNNLNLHKTKNQEISEKYLHVLKVFKARKCWKRSNKAVDRNISAFQGED